MERVRLGKTGLMVSRVGFGGIPIQRLTEDEAVRVVRRCLELDINFIDTANAYTTSERRIGKAIAGWPREQLVIATKTGARDKATALQHLAQSLASLGSDYVDLWQFHGINTIEAYRQAMGPGGVIEAAHEAMADGRVRHLGVSSHSMDVMLEMAAGGHFEVIQFPFNVVTREPEQKLLPLVRQYDLGFIAMKPLAGGMLDNVAMAFKYLLQFPGVVADPGIEQVREIEEIVALVEQGGSLSPDERVEMDRVAAELGARFCRRCDYCQPCPQEIRISTVLNLRSFWRRFPRENFLGGWVAQAVEQAKTCLKCGDCETRCPFNLPIREMLVENIEFFAGLGVS